MGEKIQRINLDKFVAKKIHTPRVDGVPIYARVDGLMESESEKTSKVKSDSWDKVIKNKYSSPDNVRRVFITYKGVETHLYCPIQGVNNKSLKIVKASEYNFEKLLNERLSREFGSRGNVVSGSGISAIYKPWVCSNIEELYFDWVVLLSDSVLNMGYGDLIMEYGPHTDKELPIDILKELFKRNCLEGVKGLRNRYPRLSKIVYIKNGDEGKRTILTLGDAERNNNRSIKSNVYLFDRDILDKYFTLKEKKINASTASSKTEEPINGDFNDADKKEEAVKDIFEETLDMINRHSGLEGVQTTLGICLKDSTEKEREDIYNKFTEEGKRRYREFMGI